MLVNCFCKIDPHYRYTKKELKVSVAKDEMEDGDDLFEERYNAGVENGDIVD